MSTDDITKQLKRAWNRPAGVQRIDALCAVADQLEAGGQLKEAFSLKLQITTAADSAGLHERALEAFAWCRARQQEDPRQFTQNILHAHERLVHSLIGEIPYARVQAVLDDFERATRAAGGDLYKVYWQREVVAWFRGDEAQADHYAELMLREPLPPGQCRVCDLNFDLRRWAEYEDPSLMLRKVEPVLTGELRCNSVPRTTRFPLMLPLLRAGRHAEAEQAYQACRNSLLGGSPYDSNAGLCMRYLALVEAWDEGIELLQRHLGAPKLYVLDSYAFTAFEGAWILCEKLQRQGRTELPGSVGRNIGVPPEQAGSVPTGVVSQWLHGHMTRIAAHLDRNNASDRFAQMMARDARLVEVSFAPRAAASATTAQ